MGLAGAVQIHHKELKYSKVISSDGRYSASLSCAFNEDRCISQIQAPA